MKMKKLFLLLSWGILSGFVLGLIKIAIEVQKHNYLGFKMYRLILAEGAQTLNIWSLGSLVILLMGLALAVFFNFLRKKVFNPFLEVKFLTKKNLMPLIQGLILGAILIYGIVLVSQYFMDSTRERPQFPEIIILAILLFLYILIPKLKLTKAHINRIIHAKIIKKAAVALGALLLVINLLSFVLATFLIPSGPSVLFIIADCLRPDHLGYFGYDRDTSPEIDKFAAESVVFENTFSNAPWTKPSMGTLITSMLPYEHGALLWSDSLHDNCLTLAELFRNQNYSTFAIQTNPSLRKVHNFHQGFQTYEEILLETDEGFVLETAETVTAKFLHWNKKQKKPFFAYLHYMDTHVPYNAPREFAETFGLETESKYNPGEFKTIEVRVLTKLGLSEAGKKEIIQLYDGAISYFDAHFRKILEELKIQGKLDNTIVVLISDHGEEFWEHGGFAHGQSLYNELLHVVYMIHYPKLLSPKKVESIVQLIDVYPTLLELADIKKYPLTTGMNLLPVILNETPLSSRPVFCEGILYGYEKRGIILNNWKLIENTDQMGADTLPLLGDISKVLPLLPTTKFELYNLAQDFSENDNQASANPELMLDLKNRIKLFNLAHNRIKSSKKTNLERKREDLKALGYIK